MPIQGINDAAGPVLGAQPRSAEDLDSMDFMTLLITQIQNQDPLSPMDNQEFIGQLTQFTSLQEMQDMGASLEDNLVLTQSLNNTMMLGLVGRQVTVEGDQVVVADGVASQNRIQTAQGGSARVEVRDAADILITSYEVPVTAGMTDISWDGSDADGEPVADGRYTLEVTVTGKDEASVPFVTTMTAPVDGIRYENNLAIVEVAGRDFYVSEIMEVRR
jgi:flagellar basal-body rod modification protein FlgD